MLLFLSFEGHSPSHGYAVPAPSARGPRNCASTKQNDKLEFVISVVDFLRKSCILVKDNCISHDAFRESGTLPTEGPTVSGTKRPEAEDSLENTFSCVPKVQGDFAESLRQTDGDA